MNGAGRSSRVDIVFTRQRLAVFVDGCFWHGCPQHLQQPKVNSQWWRQKLQNNQRRDRLVGEALEKAGWRVVRLWEHLPADEAADLGAERLPLSCSMTRPPERVDRVRSETGGGLGRGTDLAHGFSTAAYAQALGPAPGLPSTPEPPEPRALLRVVSDRL